MCFDFVFSCVVVLFLLSFVLFCIVFDSLDYFLCFYFVFFFYVFLNFIFVHVLIIFVLFLFFFFCFFLFAFLFIFIFFAFLFHRSFRGVSHRFPIGPRIGVSQDRCVRFLYFYTETDTPIQWYTDPRSDRKSV